MRLGRQSGALGCPPSLFLLSKSYFIGDDERDIEAGTKGGCKCRMIDRDNTILDIVKDIVALEKKI